MKGIEKVQSSPQVHQKITAWTEHTDDQGHRFYFNRVKGKSSWTDPRPAKCHILSARKCIGNTQIILNVSLKTARTHRFHFDRVKQKNSWTATAAAI